MRTPLKIAATILSMIGIGFCMAYVVEEIWEKRTSAGRSSLQTRAEAKSGMESDAGSAAAAGREDAAPHWRESLRRSARADVGDFVDRLLGEEGDSGRLLLEAALPELDQAELEGYFAELMARDLESGQALPLAGRALREIAARSPEAAVGLLYAMSPAEREKLAVAVAEGWVAFDPRSAFDWIDSTWLDPEGDFVDRRLQNELYTAAMTALSRGEGGVALASELVAGLRDPELKSHLVGVVARQVVQDGPEQAMARLAEEGSGLFDRAVMDAIAEEWAARDGRGAMGWTLENEEEVSPAGARSIARHLLIGADEEGLRSFHQQLSTAARRSAVAAEAARVLARRDPIRSADWALAIVDPAARREAVQDALYEIGYDSLQQVVDYVDYVYAAEEPDRVPTLFGTLRNWMGVDRAAVVDYLLSERAKMPDAVIEELLLLP